MLQGLDLEFRGTPRFRLAGRIGAGGMGVVYRALDTERNRLVALKTLSHCSPDMIVRLKNEFHALADLSHPNLVHLHELYSEHGHWFFTMELLEGSTFLEHVRALPGSAAATSWDEGRLRDALAQLASGLLALHEAHKVHRDIKPSNVLVTGAGRVVLLDFGLVSDVSPVPDETLETNEFDIVGTFDYMAPEQCSSPQVGPEADWYSVGVLLYEALTGERPFTGRPLEVLMRKAHVEPPPPRRLQPSAPEDLSALCAALLAIEPGERPRGPEVLERLGAGAAARPSRRVAPAPPFVGREAELRLLEQAFARSRAGAASVFVHGESGVGKSALVRAFRRHVAATAPEGLILAGRCYER